MVAEYTVGKYVGAVDLHINSSIFARNVERVCVVAWYVDLSAPYRHPVCTNMASRMAIKITASEALAILFIAHPIAFVITSSHIGFRW